MKTEQFKRCVEKLVQEYERSKGKHADFDTVDRAWRAIQREYCEVMNEMLRDTIKDDALAMEMLHLSNVALQGYMFLMEDDKDGYLGEYALRDDLPKAEKENKTMNKEWWDGVIEACRAMRDGKEAQVTIDGGKTWETKKHGGNLFFDFTCQYRAKPEPKLRPLTPQEWLKALMAGKKPEDNVSFSLTTCDENRRLLIRLEYRHGACYYTPEEMLSEGLKFSNGPARGIELIA